GRLLHGAAGAFAFPLGGDADGDAARRRRVLPRALRLDADGQGPRQPLVPGRFQLLPRALGAHGKLLSPGASPARLARRAWAQDLVDEPRGARARLVRQARAAARWVACHALAR